jgi:mannose-6-phosphate isomerase-like protein (cupin superfamily)
VKIRRVATGTGPDGAPTVVSDELVDPVTVRLLPGCEFHDLWGSDEPLRVPNDGRKPQAPGYFPGSAGCRFLVFTIPPQGERDGDIDYPSAFAEAERKLPGMFARMERDAPGMHATDTVDFDFVIEGEVVLGLGDGTEVALKAGDAVVQNGTRHRWRNVSGRPCRVLACLVGARRETAG